MIVLGMRDSKVKEVAKSLHGFPRDKRGVPWDLKDRFLFIGFSSWFSWCCFSGDFWVPSKRPWMDPLGNLFLFMFS